MSTLLVNEKLAVENTDRIMQLLLQADYGEHSILIYPNLDTFREVYTHQVKARVQKNDIVALLPHYENLSSIQIHLSELDLDINALQADKSLLILDSAKVFFTDMGFFAFARGLEDIAKRRSKSGAFIFADMGSFFHRNQLLDLLMWETSMPAKNEMNSTLVCCYHFQDLKRLSEEQKKLLCKHHYTDLHVKNADANADNNTTGS